MNPVLANIELSKSIYNKLSDLNITVDTDNLSLKTVKYYRDANDYKTLDYTEYLTSSLGNVNVSNIKNIIDIVSIETLSKKILYYVYTLYYNGTNDIINVIVADENMECLSYDVSTIEYLTSVHHVISYKNCAFAHDKNYINYITFNNGLEHTRYIQLEYILDNETKTHEIYNMYRDNDLLFIMGNSYIIRIPINEFTQKVEDEYIKDNTKPVSLKLDEYKIIIKENFDVHGIIKGKEGYVAIGNDSITKNIIIMFSFNGVQWYSSQLSEIVGTLLDVIYNKGVYVAIGYKTINTTTPETYETICLISYDTINWESKILRTIDEMCIKDPLDNITTCGNQFFISSTKSKMCYTSYDLELVEQYHETNVRLIKNINNMMFVILGSGITIKYSKNVLMFERDSIADETLEASNGPGTVIVSRTPFRNPMLYLGFGFWVLGERCDGICEYTRII